MVTKGSSRKYPHSTMMGATIQKRAPEIIPAKALVVFAFFHQIPKVRGTNREARMMSKANSIRRNTFGYTTPMNSAIMVTTTMEIRVTFKTVRSLDSGFR